MPAHGWPEIRSSRLPVGETTAVAGVQRWDAGLAWRCPADTAEHKRGWVEMVPLACLTRRPVQLTGWKQHHHIFFSFAKTS